MKADELPEETNNPKPQESGEVNPPSPSSLSESPLTSDTTALSVNPANNAAEWVIPQDALTPEKIPIIESSNSESAGKNPPPELLSSPPVNVQTGKGGLAELEAFSSLAMPAVEQKSSEAARVESAASPVDGTISQSSGTEITTPNLEIPTIAPEQTQQVEATVSAESIQSTNIQPKSPSQENISNPSAIEEKRESKELEVFSSLAMAVAQNALEATRVESEPSPIIDETVSPSAATEIEPSNTETQVITPEQNQQYQADIAVESNQLASLPPELESQTTIANLCATDEVTRVESEPAAVDETVNPYVATEIESSNLETQTITPEQTQPSQADIAVSSNQSTSLPPEPENQEDFSNLAITEDKGEMERLEVSSSQPMAVAQNAEVTRVESDPSPVEATVNPSAATEIESSNLETQTITPEQTQPSQADVAVASNQSTSLAPESESQEDITNLSATEEEQEASFSSPMVVEQNAEATRVESEPSPVDETVIPSAATEIESSNLETQVITPEQNQLSQADITVASNQSTRFSTESEIQENINTVPVTSATPVNVEDEPMRIFITGASGCIGHYIVETLIEETDYELYLLVRNPNKLRFDINARPGIHIVQGDMRDIKRFGKLLKTMNCAVLAAAGWGGQEAIDVNVFKTIELLNLLDPKVCQHIVYFSTASVLNRQNQLLKEAGQAGTAYIRSKYDFLRQVNRVPIAKRITTVFPTLVLGGDKNHPYSHVSGGLPDLMKETEILRFFNKPLLKVKPIDLIRFFQADGSFHFIHARDIAQVVRYLIDHPPTSPDDRWLVLGNEPVTLNQVVEEACAYLNKPITYRFNLSPWIANLFIRLFRIQMSAWDRFSFDYRHFTYQNSVNPSTFGMPVYCPELIDVLKLSGINGRR